MSRIQILKAVDLLKSSTTIALCMPASPRIRNHSLGMGATPYHTSDRYVASSSQSRDDVENYREIRDLQTNTDLSPSPMQYAPYTLPSLASGYSRHPRLHSTGSLPILGDHNNIGRLPTNLQVASAPSIDKLAKRHNLTSHQRRFVHEFSEMNADDRMILLYIQGQQIETRITQMAERIDMIQSSHQDIHKLLHRGWKPSKEQEKLLKALLRHYLIQPNSTYSGVAALAGGYVHDHAEKLHLLLYTTDPTVRKSVDDYLASQINNIKSAFRKLIWTSIVKKNSLKWLGQKILQSYHLPVIPATPPQDMLASFALMREVAAPLVPIKVPRGGDTGFWTAMEVKLEELYTENGNNRKSDSWTTWEKGIIETDKTKYIRSSGETQALTGLEIHQATRLGLNDDHNEDHNDPDIEGAAREDEYLMNGDVSIGDLGDLASTIVPQLASDTLQSFG